MRDNRQLIPWVIVGAVVLLAALTWGLGTGAQAAPNALVTPVTVYAAGVQSGVATFRDGVAVTADGGSAATNILSHEKADVSVVIDVGTVNTTTLKLQFSNDGTNWIDGSTIASAITADANTMQQYPIYGRFARVYADVTNTSPITLTVIGVLK